jgi:hypothetical protein
MMVRAMGATLLLACTGSPPRVAAPIALPDARAEDCPEAPLVELYAMRGEVAQTAFGCGGHITALALSTRDDVPSWVGVLDVKGAQALERGTRAIAYASVAPHDGGEAGVSWMALTLRGEPIAGFAVTTTMRGERFRLPLAATMHARPNALAAELDDALRIDRRCFAGR